MALSTHHLVSTDLANASSENNSFKKDFTTLISQSTTDAPLEDYVNQLTNSQKTLLTQDIIEVGRKNLDLGNHNVASSMFNVASQLSPNLRDAHYFNGKAKAKNSTTRDAIESYLKASQLDEYWYVGQSDIFFDIGMLMRKDGLESIDDVVNANEAFEAVLLHDDFTLEPPEKSRLKRADTFLQLRRPAEAIPDLEYVVQNDTWSYQARIKLGNLVWSLHKNGERAEQLFLECLELARKPDPYSLHGLAMVYEGTGRQEEAIQKYLQLLAIDPTHNAALAGLDRLNAK